MVMVGDPQRMSQAGLPGFSCEGGKGSGSCNWFGRGSWGWDHRTLAAEALKAEGLQEPWAWQQRSGTGLSNVDAGGG